MNTGLQDAYNLAWKLALVVQDRADAGLLDTYEAERIPVARRLLSTTDQAFRLIVSDNWLAGLFRTKLLARVMARAMTFEQVQKLAFRTISQIGIHYRESPLSKTLPGLAAGAPRAGDRFPWLHLSFQANGPVEDLYQRLDDTRFNLLTIGQPASPDVTRALGAPVHTHMVSDDPVNARELARVHISAPSFYLLRPDGHIGLAGIRLTADAVMAYLSDRHMRTGQEHR